jgi:hypothetical protein
LLLRLALHLLATADAADHCAGRRTDGSALAGIAADRAADGAEEAVAAVEVVLEQRSRATDRIQSALRPSYGTRSDRGLVAADSALAPGT